MGLGGGENKSLELLVTLGTAVARKATTVTRNLVHHFVFLINNQIWKH